jgi:hypothetical protein
MVMLLPTCGQRVAWCPARWSIAPRIALCRASDARLATAASFLKNTLHMSTRRLAESRSILSWVFRKGDDLLICSLDRNATGDFAVVLRPQHQGACRFTERTDTIASGLQRHASLACELREHEWTLVGYHAPHSPEPFSTLVSQAA